MENEKSKLYVGNLVYSTGFREVKDLFAKYGQVGYVKIIEGKGFGFVEMASHTLPDHILQTDLLLL